MTIVVNLLHWHYSPPHLEHVVQEMQRLGPPVIRAYFDGQVWHAREGCHRLRAALALGVVPILVPVPWRRTALALARARARANMLNFERVNVRPLQGSTTGLTGMQGAAGGKYHPPQERRWARKTQGSRALSACVQQQATT